MSCCPLHLFLLINDRCFFILLYFIFQKRAVIYFLWWHQLEPDMMRVRQWQVKHAAWWASFTYTDIGLPMESRHLACRRLIWFFKFSKWIYSRYSSVHAVCSVWLDLTLYWPSYLLLFTLCLQPSMLNANFCIAVWISVLPSPWYDFSIINTVVEWTDVLMLWLHIVFFRV